MREGTVRNMQPLYVGVSRAGVGVRVHATSSSTHPQLVRISANFRAGKLARIADIEPVELRLCRGSPATLVLPPRESPYWLAIVAFSQGDDGWSRSVPEQAGPLQIPQNGLTFFHRGSAQGNGSMILELSFDLQQDEPSQDEEVCHH